MAAIELGVLLGESLELALVRGVSDDMTTLSGDWLSEESEAGKLFRGTKKLSSVYVFIAEAHEGLASS